MGIKDKLYIAEEIANAAKHLLERNGIYSFGKLLTEDDGKLRYCYQKEDSFIFVNNKGEEMNVSLVDEDERWLYDFGLFGYKHPIKLLQYNEYDMTYQICNPSCEDYCSVLHGEVGNKYFIIYSDSKCLPVDIGNGSFEYIDKKQYVFLTHHQTDEIRRTDIYDRKSCGFYRSDVFFNKRTNDIWYCNGFIEYKKYIIINGLEPCTIVYDESMEEVYKREEEAVYCRLGKYAYLIFRESEVAYNIDTKVEESIEDFDKYDNYEVCLDYLMKYRITSYEKEEIELEDERFGQYEEWIPKHDVTDVIIFNSNLEIVRELRMQGVYEDIVRTGEKIFLKCSVEGKYSSNYYYDISGQKYVKYDAITHKTYSVADIVEKQVSDDIIVEEVLDTMRVYDYYVFFEQDEFDDEDEIFDCRIRIRKGDDWELLNDEIYSSIVPKYFKYPNVPIWPTYLLAIRNRKLHEYDLYANDIKLVDKGKYSDEAIKVCEEGCRIIFSDKDKFGIIGDGIIMVPLLYNSIEYYHDYKGNMSIYVIKDDKAFGILDNDGNILLQCEYAMIKCHYDWYRNLYIVLSDKEKNYSWAYCNKGDIHIDGTAIPDENSIIRTSWEGIENDGYDEIYVQVSYNIQTEEFAKDVERHWRLKNEAHLGWTDEELRDAADIAYEGYSRLELGLDD